MIHTAGSSTGGSACNRRLAGDHPPKVAKRLVTALPESTWAENAFSGVRPGLEVRNAVVAVRRPWLPILNNIA